MVAGGVGVGAGSADAATGEQIVGVASGRCLDVIGNSTKAKAGINIYDCHGKPNQLWSYTAARELRIYNASRCLDVEGKKTTAPARVEIYPCNGGTNQKWRLNSDGSIVSVQSGLCLDVMYQRTANSALVQLYTCQGRPHQRWRSTLNADKQPPTVPANPRTGGLTCDSVTFAWNAATDNVGVASYDVYHDGQLMTSVTTTSTTLAVVPGVTWGLYVNARDAAGNVSQASATVPVTPPQCAPDHEAPAAPTGLQAKVNGTTVALSWAAASDNVGVRAYEIYRDGTKTGEIIGTAAQPPATSFLDSGLRSGTTYTYAVIARDAQTNVSPPSAVVTATTAASCGNPVCGVMQVAADTDIPWGLVTLPDGSILYTRRDAHNIARLDPATGARTIVGTVPNVQSTDGEGGLTGLAIAPSFAADHWLYIMHTSPTDNRIVRIRYVDGRLDTAGEQILLSGILRNKFHDGGRLRFGPDGKLYASTGDGQNGDNAQNLASLNGKILRLNPDGTVPSDNPYGSYVWSYGHRNPQGLAFDAQGRLWEQEFGNSVMDETNLITKGGNYGWPACEGTSGSCDRPGFIKPKHTYPTADGSCSGIAAVTGALYIACERGQRLYRATITTGGDLTEVQAYFVGQFGRLRTVEPAPDGGLWLTTSNNGDKDSIPDNTDGRILHVTLAG